MRPARLRRPVGGAGADRPPRDDPSAGGRERGEIELSPVAVWSARLDVALVGTVRLWATEAGIRRVDFRTGPDLVPPGETLSTGPAPSHLGKASAALREYLDGRRERFDFPLDLGPITSFQQRVYDRLLRIPFGQVATYGEVARDIGEEPGAARAVGQAVGANPIAIVIPCHRVVASDGRLVGFGGGIQRKAALLGLEGIEVDGSRPSSRVRPEILRLPF